MRQARTCGNALCGNTFIPGRVDQFYCDSSCRAEATRLRELLHTPGPVSKAVRAALHKAPVAKRNGKPMPRKGARPDTAYTVLEVVQRQGLILSMTIGGFAFAHSREEAVRFAASELLDGPSGAGEYLPLAPKATAFYGPDGRKLDRSLIR